MAEIVDPKIVEKVRELFPNYLFLLEADASGFGMDLRDLLLKAVRENYTTDRFDKEKAQTAYFRETADAAQLYDKQSKAERDADVQVKLADIKTTYGDVYTNPEDLLRVATAAARQGLTGNRLKYFVYASATKVGAGPQVVQTASADKLRKNVGAYGYRASDEQINAALSGKPYRGEVYTEDSLVKMAKLAAKGTYGHLAPQIDAGLSLDDIFKNYRAYASQILELDPDEIDFVKDPKWADAFGDAKQGQLSLSAWQQKLKTDDKYGWKFTNQANQQVAGVVSTLERAFGLVR